MELLAAPVLTLRGREIFRAPTEFRLCYIPLRIELQDSFEQAGVIQRPRRLNCLLTLVQRGDRVHVEIHSQSVAELICDEFGIDTSLVCETRMSASHDLKGRPAEFDRFEFGRDEPSPRVIPSYRCVVVV